MWFLYLLSIAIALVIAYVIAKKFADIAEMKGHEGNTYFWFTFWLGVVGMLMVVALPNKNGVCINNSPTTYVEPKQTTPPVAVIAPVATDKNPNKAKAPVSAEIKDSEKVCPKCGTVQKADRRVCWSCGQHFDN